MEHLIEEAFRVAMRTEINSYRTYCNAAVAMSEGSGRELLETLAREELKIIKELSGNSPSLVAGMAEEVEDRHPHCFFPSPQESPEYRLFKQLRVALIDKHCSIEKYMIFAASFRKPELSSVFDLVLGMSQNLFEFIVDAYRQADLRLQRPKLGRRKKRTHIKAIPCPAPNKHTELFISLLDSGRSNLL